MGLIPAWGARIHKLCLKINKYNLKKFFNVKIKENNLLDDYNIQINEMNDSDVIRDERGRTEIDFKKVLKHPGQNTKFLKKEAKFIIRKKR